MISLYTSFFTSNKWSGKGLAAQTLAINSLKRKGYQNELNIPFSPLDILIDYNPWFSQYTKRFQNTFVMVYDSLWVHRRLYPYKQKPPLTLPPTMPILYSFTYILFIQLCLALIVETIHTVLLLHDDVLDN